MKKGNILIADAGSTKVEWVLLREDEVAPRFLTGGINAAIADSVELEQYFKKVAEKLLPYGEVKEIYYYGAGCANDELCEKVRNAFYASFPAAEIEVASDMLGAARALLGDSAGIACILGTGSNSVLYDGEKIVENIPPLGFILGDEGSGAVLGKRLIKEIFKGNPGREIKDAFFLEYPFSIGEVIKKVYREPGPNKFLASLVPFIRKHTIFPFISNMVEEEFREFFRRNPGHYPDARTYPVAFTGSVAFHFSDLLETAAEAEGFRLGKIVKAPMDDLIKYHLSHQS